MAEAQNRDANHLRWQESIDFGIRVSGPEYRKMEHRETMWWKNVKTVVSKRWHPSFKNRYESEDALGAKAYSYFSGQFWFKIYICAMLVISCLFIWTDEDRYRKLP